MTLPYQKTETSDEMLTPLRVEYAAQVRQGLLRFGYAGDAVGALVAEAREKGEAGLGEEGVARELPPVTPLACLVRAFTMHVATAEEDLRRELGEEFFAACESAGLWRRVESGVTGRAVVLADQGSFLVHDHVKDRAGDAEMYWVMGVGASTMQVAHSVPGRPYGRVLDLCCGSGIQSFLLAPYAREIVALDRNPRAVNYGRFGAALNEFGNITFLESDLFAAVAGEQFDAVVCNPPYVLSPEREKYYRDGGMTGDEFAEKILREAPAYLREDGFAHFVCDVATVRGVSSEERLHGWLAGNGCDVLAIAAPPMEPLEYAALWLKPEGEETREALAAKWLACFGELGIESVTHFLVVLRRRTGKNWMVLEPLPKRTEGHIGAQVARRFRCQDFVRREGEALWATRLRLVPEARLQRTGKAVNGRWVTEEAKVLIATGLMYEFMVDPRTVDFLLFFDGTATMEEVLARVAGAMGIGVEKVRGGWLGYVRQLAGDGVLEPVDA